MRGVGLDGPLLVTVSADETARYERVRRVIRRVIRRVSP